MDEAGEELHCPHCDYCLTGLPHERCPECGRAFDLTALRVAKLDRPRLSWSGIARLLLAPIAATVAYPLWWLLDHSDTPAANFKAFTVVCGLVGLAMAVLVSRELVPATTRGSSLSRGTARAAVVTFFVVLQTLVTGCLLGSIVRADW